MLWWVSCLLCTVAGDLISGVYIWGPSGLDPEETLNLVVGTHLELSFVRVDFIDGELVVDGVQRGSSWDFAESFCSLMLPAVVRDFLTTNNIDISRDVKLIEVTNAARPREAGFRCYSRMINEFGFQVETNDWNLIIGRPDGVVPPSIGTSSELQLSLLAQVRTKRIFFPLDTYLSRFF
jgi:hypothetical protein